MTRARDQVAPPPAGATFSAVGAPTSGSASDQSPGPIPRGLPGAVLLARVTDLCARHAPRVLRLSLALVFVWFGVLKIIGDSPVKGLLGATLPFLNPAVTIPVLGVIEVALGLAVALGRAPRVTLLVLVGHLIGTFLTFVTATGLVIQHGNPFLLTADGEFVVKNLVLISAALVLVGRCSLRSVACPQA